MALESPIWAFIQAAQQQEKNRQQALADAQGIGKNLGGLGQQIQQQGAQTALQQALQTMRTGQMAPSTLPMQGPMPPTAGPAIQGPAGYMPPGGGGNMVAAGQQPMNGPTMDRPMLPNPQKQDAMPDIGMLYGLGQKAYGDNNPFKTAMTDSFDPLKMAQAEWYKTRGNGQKGYLANVTWDTATPEQQHTATALMEGRIRPSDLGLRDRAISVMLANEHAKTIGVPFQSYGGDVKAGMAKYNAFGKGGQNALSLNTALGHAGAALEAYQDIENTDINWLNQPINVVKKGTNDPGIVKLGITLNALRGELANVFKNSGGTDQEISSWKEYLNEDLTPKQAMAAIQQVDDLLRSRLNALDYNKQDVMNNPPSERKLLSPHGAELSNKFNQLGKGNPKTQKVVEDGWVYTPGLGGKSNKANWEKQ